LLLDGVQSPYNVGAIVRTAAAYRVDHLYLGADTLSPTHAKVGKLSMGTERYLSWSSWAYSRDAADAARDDGYTVIGLELVDDAVPLHQLHPGLDVCLSQATLAACDAVAFLPQMGRVASLNVATAAAIAIYELRRQSWA
jgi:tRNA (guanosine-2'-O-)-methyltransferase